MRLWTLSGSDNCDSDRGSDCGRDKQRDGRIKSNRWSVRARADRLHSLKVIHALTSYRERAHELHERNDGYTTQRESERENGGARMPKRVFSMTTHKK